MMYSPVCVCVVCVCVCVWFSLCNQLNQQVHSPNTILLLRHFLETLVRIAALGVHEHTHEDDDNEDQQQQPTSQTEHKHDNTHTHTHTHTHCIAEKLNVFLRDFVLPRAKTTKTMLIADQKLPAVHISVRFL